MQLFIKKTSLKWGELDLPLLGISSDWFGEKLHPPLAFSLAADAEHLWFVTTRQAPHTSHPHSTPRAFTPSLWKYDTAELFIAESTTTRYIEFNIAPNGAWWAAEFSSPRVPSPSQPDFQRHITAHADTHPTHWTTALSIPLTFLKDTIDFGPLTKANTSFILNSPHQTFHSFAKLPGKQPDFHQPSAFPRLSPLPDSP